VFSVVDWTAWSKSTRWTLASGGLATLCAMEARSSAWRFQYGLLSLPLSGRSKAKACTQPNNTNLVVGSSDGSLSIRKRQASASELAARATAKSVLKSGTYESFLAGQSQTGIYSGAEAKQPVVGSTQDELEVRVSSKRQKKFREWDKLLKNFRHGDALDSVMQPVRLMFSVRRELGLMSLRTGTTCAARVFGHYRADPP
jgi:U3 small nucleolar RNA-associated protein 15